MESRFINAVVKNIKSKSKKDAVEAELYDHIFLNQQFYEEIGYEDEAAFEKAEEKMGDAESVSVLFSETGVIGNTEFSLYIFAFLLVPLIAFGCFAIYSKLTFFSYIFANILLITTIIYTCFALKKLNIISGTIGFIGIGALALIQPLDNIKIYTDNILNSVSLFFRGISINENVFDISSFDYGTYGFVCYFFGVFVFTMLLSLIILRIRVIKLKNTRRDLTVKRILKYILLCMLFIFSVACMFNVYMCYANNYQEKIYLEQRESIAEYDKGIIKELKKGYKALDEYVLKESRYDFNENKSREYVSKEHYFDDYGYSFSFNTKLVNEVGYKKDFCTKDEIKEIKSMVDKGDFSIYKVKCPFAFTYEYDKSGNERTLKLIFSYGKGSYNTEFYPDYVLLKLSEDKTEVVECSFNVEGSSEFSYPVTSEDLVRINTQISKYIDNKLLNEKQKPFSDLYDYGANYEFGYYTSGEFLYTKGISLSEINKKYNEIKIESQSDFLDIYYDDENENYKACVILMYCPYTVYNSMLFNFGIVCVPSVFTFEMDSDVVTVTDMWYPKNDDNLDSALKKNFTNNSYYKISDYDNHPTISSVIAKVEKKAGYQNQGTIYFVDENGNFEYKLSSFDETVIKNKFNRK